MIRIFFTFAIWVLFFQPGLTAQDIPEDNLGWASMEQALDLAAEEDKLILIDVFAVWCPYCQRMQEEVYPSKSVEEQINRYFIPVRIDTESEASVNFLGNHFTEAEFAQALNYSSVPTTYFMNQNGEVVGQQPGFLPEDIFSSLLEFVGSGAFEEKTFEEFDQ